MNLGVTSTLIAVLDVCGDAPLRLVKYAHDVRYDHNFEQKATINVKFALTALSVGSF